MTDTPTQKDVAQIMAAMDLCFMTTSAQDGGLSTRPMSNNAEVAWDGTNWFFSHGDTRKVAELRADPHVALSFQSDDTWISLTGRASLHQDDRALFEEHWSADIERWFEDGIDTPGLTLIRVAAQRAEVQGRPGEAIIELE